MSSISVKLRGKAQDNTFQLEFRQIMLYVKYLQHDTEFLIVNFMGAGESLEEADSWCQKHISEIENGKNKSGQSYFLLKLSNSTTYAA